MTMKPISQKYFERLYKSADEIIVCGQWDYIIIKKNENERKFPISLYEKYIDNIYTKYNITKK